MTRQWYRFSAKADASVVELFIYGDIGKSFWDDDAVTAKQFMDDLTALAAEVKTIVVRVNSLGGDVYEGVAIANALRDQSRSKGRTVHTIVDGIAASVASIVIMAGETIQIADNGLIFIHEPWTIEIGNAGVMRKTADALDKIRDTLVTTYQWHSSLSDDALRDLMKNETWFDADESIANGFATEKVEGLKAAALLDPRALAKLKVPEKFKARVTALVQKPDPPADPPKPAPAVDVLRICREGDCLDLAEGLIAASATLGDVQAKVVETKTTKAATAARAAHITAICATAKQPELAAGYIAGAMTPDAVKQHMTVITAKLDKVEIDGSLLPDKGVQGKKVIDATAIYAERNRRSAN